MGGAALPLALLGSSALGAIGNFVGPGDQNFKSFDKFPGIAPPDLLTELRELVMQNLLPAQDRSLAANVYPIDLGPSTAVQPLPTFTGGGLPFPIGMLGQDPGFADPTARMLTPPNASYEPPNTSPRRIGQTSPGLPDVTCPPGYVISTGQGCVPLTPNTPVPPGQPLPPPPTNPRPTPGPGEPCVYNPITGRCDIPVPNDPEPIPDPRGDPDTGPRRPPNTDFAPPGGVYDIAGAASRGSGTGLAGQTSPLRRKGRDLLSGPTNTNQAVGAVQLLMGLGR